MSHLTRCAVLTFLMTSISTANPAAFTQTEQNAARANQALLHCRDFVRAWLDHADPISGLIPRNLTKGRDFWNAKDAAADNYPFMVLTAAIIDKPLFQGRLQDMLLAETRLTCRLDRLPDDYSFSKQGFLHDQPDVGRCIFGGSEYVKDGLLPLTEWLGRSPWSTRMIGIVDDVWKHAPVETKYGRIPSTSHEVNGEMLQVLSRLYWMTGKKEYLDYAFRLADYYLFDHHPTRDEDNLRLRDHGCEILSGLAEAYAAAHFAAPDKKKAYHDPIHAMFDRVLEIARNEHGLLYNRVNPKTGEATDNRCCDTWGYNYNGVYTVYLVDDTEAYRDAVRDVLSNLNEHYRGYMWGHKSVIADEYADSIEGAINLFNREPIPSVAEWIDSEIQIMFDVQKPDGIVEGWHGDGNFARTAIMYALWRTQGTTVTPWRADVQFGAVEKDDTLYVTVSARWPWQGKLVFDRPRHKTDMKLPLDYPRINQFPEWFTVDAKGEYAVTTDAGTKTYTGRQLLDGIAIELTSEQRQSKLAVRPAVARK